MEDAEVLDGIEVQEDAPAPAELARQHEVLTEPVRELDRARKPPAIIPGRLGQVEWFDGASLAVYTARRRMIPKLRALPGLRPWQTGDDEARFLFAPEALAAVAAVIRARRRGIRVMTPEALAVLAAGRQKALAVYPSATSRPQDRAGAIRTALPMLVARATG